jgi:dienelactone hydrolase
MAVAGALAAAILPGIAGAQATPRPDLTVSGGLVSATNGQLKGSFAVRNKGTGRSGRFSATLIIRVPGKNREVKRFPLRPLNPSGSRTVEVAVAVPSPLPTGSLPIRACVDKAGKVRERSERNNCRKVGTIQVGAGSPGPIGPPGPASSVPKDPIAFTTGVPFTLNSSESNYWVYVPNSYDATHATPTTLFVWLHGCGGESSGDIYTVSPGGAQDWISIAVGGREGGCWDPNSDQAKVLAAIADMKTHFNVNPRRVILGGYSSGGDLAYRLAFYNAGLFAGILVENTSPFRDTGSSRAASLAAASWKFNVVHLAHLQDTTYPIAGVREETDAMAAAGFPLTRLEVDGGHYDEPGAIENGHAVPGTNADLATYLLPHIDDGWLSP